MLRDSPAQRALGFNVGIADGVPKLIAYGQVAALLRIDEPVRLVCHERPLDSLLATLAVNRVDRVIADGAMPTNANVCGFALTAQTRFLHPALIAVTEAARKEVFANS